MPTSSLVGPAAGMTAAADAAPVVLTQAPGPAVPAVAAPGDSFTITVAPDTAASHEDTSTQKLIEAARPRPAAELTATPDELSTPEATPAPQPALDSSPPTAAAAYAPITARRNTPTLAPPRLPTHAPIPAGVDPNRMATSGGAGSSRTPAPTPAPAMAAATAATGPILAPSAAPVAAAPQLLTPATNSDGLRPMLVAPGSPALAPEKGFGHNALRNSGPAGATPTYRNVLREGPVAEAEGAGENSGIEQTAARQRGSGFPKVVPAAANPVARSTAPGAAVSGPATGSPAPSTTGPTTTTTAKSTAPTTAATTGPASKSTAPTTSAAGASPSVAAPSNSPPRSAVVAPRTGAAVGSRGSAYAGDDKEPGSLDKKSVIGNQPVERKSQQLFESEQQPTAMTAELELLRKRVQTALAYYYQNWTLNTREHSPWEVMHAIIAYGVDTRLAKGHAAGERTTAIGHLCFSGICNNQPILTIRNDKLYALRGPGVQGHSGQFLAILAQSYLQRDYPLYVGGEKYTLEDLIRAEQEDCESGTELTFKLIGLMHYLPSDATWTNFQGQTWSLDRLVREEIVQPIRGAACGGTHRLMGLSYAIRKREQRGEPISGIYLEARKYIDQYHKYTFSLQNRDGSFSTAWFVRPEARNDLDRRMQTTGHVLEWLCFSLSDEQLRDPRVVRAVQYITNQLLSQGVQQWEIGHLGHALHALQIYNERVFGGPVRSFEGLVRRPAAKTARAPTATPETVR
jgi:hypothetical protein